MIANKGFIIEEDRGVPDGEEQSKSFDPRFVDEYFARDLTLDSDDEEDDVNEGTADLSFDLRAQKMVDLLPDGGVKKKVLNVIARLKTLYVLSNSFSSQNSAHFVICRHTFVSCLIKCCSKVEHLGGSRRKSRMFF